jgi:hypothetical protein
MLLGFKGESLHEVFDLIGLLIKLGIEKIELLLML